MDKPCRSAAINTKPSKHRGSQALLLAFCLGLFAFSNPSWGTAGKEKGGEEQGSEEKTEQASLKPYQAHYQLTGDRALKRLSRELQKTGDNRWQLNQSASLWMFSISETSQMNLLNNKQDVQSQRYIYNNSASSKRNQDVWFDREAGTAENRNPERTWTVDASADSNDILANQLQLRLDFIHGRFEQRREYPAIAKGKSKRYIVEKLGEEILSTEFGDVWAVKLKQYREGKDKYSHIWLARDYQYLILRIAQYEPKTVPRILSLSSLSPGIESFKAP